MDTNIINECKKLSLEGKASFPEIVMKLLNAGVERYLVDLVALKCIYYGINNESYVIDFDYKASPVASQFDGRAVKAAITSIQQGKINYQEFLRLIIEAGCSHYESFLTGKKVIYVGRDGSQHIELFPGAK